MGLMQYIRIGLRWWWLILISVVLSAAASYYYSQQLPKIYSARATLTVGNNIIDDPNPDVRTLGSIRTLTEVYAELVTRVPMAQRIVDRLGLDIDPTDLSDMVETQIIPDAQLLEIYVMDTSPERAQLLADTFAEELILQSPTNSSDRQEREEFVHSQITELQTKIEETNQKIKVVEDRLPNLVSAIEIDEAKGQLAGLETLKADYQRNYSQFLANLSDNSINRLSIFEYALTPQVPISPNIRLNTMIAGLAGFLLALVAIILIEFYDDSLVWQNAKTQKVAGVPVLGSIKKTGRTQAKLISQDRLWSTEAEAFRALRSSILLAANQQALSTVLITSSTPNEGKTFVSSNLAVAAAASGTHGVSAADSAAPRVILVDADLRKPSLHELFDLPNVFGLMDVLSAPEGAVESTLQQALRPTHIHGLTLLPAGRTPLDPGLLLASGNFQTMLHQLKNQAELVIIDSAPLLTVIETRAIVNAVDATVLVVSNRQTREKTVKKVVEYFDNRVETNLLGLVFNRVNYSGLEDGRYSGYYSDRSPLPPLGESVNRPAMWSKIWPFGQTPPTNPDAITLNDVAVQLGIKKETARRWCEDGRLPATKEGSRWVVLVDDLQEFITTFQHAPAADGRNSNNLSRKAKVKNL